MNSTVFGLTIHLRETMCRLMPRASSSGQVNDPNVRSSAYSISCLGYVLKEIELSITKNVELKKTVGACRNYAVPNEQKQLAGGHVSARFLPSGGSAQRWKAL